MLGNAESLFEYPIVYCSDGFTSLTGYQRSEVIGNSCNCSFLHSIRTNHATVVKIKEALKDEKDFRSEIDFSKKDGNLKLHLILTLSPKTGVKNTQGVENTQGVKFVKRKSKSLFSPVFVKDTFRNMVKNFKGQI